MTTTTQDEIAVSTSKLSEAIQPYGHVWRPYQYNGANRRSVSELAHITLQKADAKFHGGITRREKQPFIGTAKDLEFYNEMLGLRDMYDTHRALMKSLREGNLSPQSLS